MSNGSLINAYGLLKSIRSKLVEADWTIEMSESDHALRFHFTVAHPDESREEIMHWISETTWESLKQANYDVEEYIVNYINSQYSYALDEANEKL